MILRNFIIILSIVGLILPSFSFAQLTQPPETLEEAKSVGLNILSQLPAAVKKVWQEEAWPFILKMWGWVKGFWDSYVGSRVESWWQKLLNLVGKETPDLQSEFQKEKQEMQTDLPKVGQPLWERFKELWQ